MITSFEVGAVFKIIAATMRARIFAAAMLLASATSALAQSTIPQGVPATNSNLNSLVIRQITQAAASDVNGLLSGHVASSLGNCPSNPYIFTDCVVIGTPYTWFKWMGASWAEVATFASPNGPVGIALSSSNFINNPPVSILVNNGVATFSARLTDGTTVFASGTNDSLGASDPTQMTIMRLVRAAKLLSRDRSERQTFGVVA